jgi:hypothetical protein
MPAKRACQAGMVDVAAFEDANLQAGAPARFAVIEILATVVERIALVQEANPFNRAPRDVRADESNMRDFAEAVPSFAASAAAAR